MRWLLLMLFSCACVGCGSSVDNPQTATSPTTTPDPDWLLPAGEKVIDDSWPPTVFTASIGGFSGHSFKVELNKDGELVYRQNPNGFTEWGGTSEDLMVTEDMWNEFRDRLNSAEVWKWRRRYDDPKIADGTVWELKIEYFNQTIVSSGSNAYPSNDQFNIFLDAVSDLVDGKPFE